MSIEIIERPTMILGIDEMDFSFFVPPTPRMIDALIREQVGSGDVGQLTARVIWGSELSGLLRANGFRRIAARCFEVGQRIPSIDECIEKYVKEEDLTEGVVPVVAPYAHAEQIAVNGISIWVPKASTVTTK